MEPAQAREILEMCRQYAELSTCNKRKTGAALVLPDGTMHYATNGSQTNPCTERGTEYCIREQDPGPVEYLTCPSRCAEGEVMLHALTGGKALRGGIIVSTDFPCERCTALIIDSGISELYFGDFKDRQRRPRDTHYIILMAGNNVRVNQLIDKGCLDYEAFGGPEFGTFRHAIRVPGQFFLDAMSDPARKEDLIKSFRGFRQV